MLKFIVEGLFIYIVNFVVFIYISFKKLIAYLAAILWCWLGVWLAFILYFPLKLSLLKCGGTDEPSAIVTGVFLIFIYFASVILVFIFVSDVED
jgi:hypothetical protein